MSIQTRLTLSFTTLFGFIVLGLAIGSYVLVRNDLFSDLNTELQVAVDGTAISAEHEMNEHSTVAPGEADIQEVLNARADAALPNTQILIRQGSRQVAYKAGAHATMDLRNISSDSLRSKTFKSLHVAFRHYLFRSSTRITRSMRLRRLPRSKTSSDSLRCCWRYCFLLDWRSPHRLATSWQESRWPRFTV